jgi:hypothetical protein
MGGGGERMGTVHPVRLTEALLALGLEAYIMP